MQYFVDTSVLIRFVAPDDPLHGALIANLLKLREEGHALCITPQTVREAWSVMTRPKAANGYGVSNEAAGLLVTAAEKAFAFLDDTPGIYSKWIELVKEHNVMGKQIHDANHVAAMLTHGISHVLTLDDRDFRRYPMITVVRPDIE